MKRLHIYLALCLLPFACATAQRAYTLDECRAMALDHNRRVANAAHALAAARQQKSEAFTNYFPDVSASVAAFAADKGLMSAMDMSMLKNGWLGGVTLTQPVFAGGRIVNANRLAAVGVEAATQQRRQAADEVRQQVDRYFWQVATLQEKLLTLDVLAEQLDRLCADVEAAVAAGVTTRNDLLQVQLRQNDILSQRLDLDNNLAVARMLLAQQVGLGCDTLAIAAAIAVGELPPLPQELHCDHRQALLLTPSYALLQSNVEAARLQQRLERGKSLPSLAVGAGLVHDNLSDRDDPAALVFATISIPISGWWGGSHAVKRKKYQLATAQNELDDNAELLLIGMERAWNTLKNAHSQTLIACKSIEQSSENLRLNQEYYRAGTTTMSDLLEAQTLYQQSRDQYVEAYASLQVATTAYLVATGR